MRLIGFVAMLIATAGPAGAESSPAPLVALYTDWRAFARPAATDGVVDYSASAMARTTAGLARMRARLKALDRTGWSVQTQDDARLIGAEMDGLDFELRVLRPWARDPSYYATVFGEESDVPAHEGPSAAPTIDLFRYHWPLSRPDDRALTASLAAVPRMLDRARATLAPSTAHDLWAYGDRAFREQSATLAALAAGTLRMRTLDGHILADMRGTSPALRQAIVQARAATDAFAYWIIVEAPKRTGPSGVGKAAYDWHAAHVQLSPYNWDQQVELLLRELDRALASLRLEELRNRALPPIAPIENPAAYREMAKARTRRFIDFLVATGLMPDRPYFRAALENQASDYVAPGARMFFDHGSALDPLPLLSHSSHWIELARLRDEPNPDPIRRAAPLYNIYADRSEGFATAMEELVLHAGLYDDMPRAREIVWIMLANRAARGLASLYVQANMMTLAEAGRFHAQWTPRGWSDPNSKLVGFEQLLYLRQPGYGPSYVIGKVQLDRLLADASHAADQAGRPFVMRDAFTNIVTAGIIPPALIEREMAR